MLQTIVRPTVDALELATQPTRKPESHPSAKSSRRFEETLRRATAATERDPVAEAEKASTPATQESQAETPEPARGEEGSESSASEKDGEARPADGTSKAEDTPDAKAEQESGAERTAASKSENHEATAEEEKATAKSVARDKQGNDKPVSRDIREPQAEGTAKETDATGSTGADTNAPRKPHSPEGAEAETDRAEDAADVRDAARKDHGPARAQAAGAESRRKKGDAEKSGGTDNAPDAARAAGAEDPARREAARGAAADDAGGTRAARRRAAQTDGDEAAHAAAGTRTASPAEPAVTNAVRARAAAAEALGPDGRAAGASDGEGEAAGHKGRVIVVDARGGAAGEGGADADTRRDGAGQPGTPRQHVAADSGVPKGETEAVRVANQFDLPQHADRPAQTAAPTQFRDVYSGFLRQMREQGNGEIVRQSTLVLRNADSGEIRLVLKPESLGEVRIRVQLQDNHIAGRIVVENNSVREMFQENLEALTRAFRESGYDTGSLDVEVRDRGGDGRRRHAGDLPGSRLIRELEESVPSLASVGDSESLVDVFV